MKRLLFILPKAGMCAFFTLLLAWPGRGYSQSEEIFRQSLGVSSPQTWAFARYSDKIEPDLYTGTMALQVPIYTYTDNDFNIPISLGYASNGLMPNVQTGPLGLGWFLNAGGVISREIVGVPDDIGGYNILHNKINGFGETHKSQNSAMPKSFDNINPDALSAVETLVGNRTLYYKINIGGQGNFFEVNPDLFHFNFMGYKGTFMLGFNKKIHVFNTNFPEGEIKIEKDLVGKFILTMGDGYKYEFADTERVTDEEGGNELISSWLLNKIIAPNGRVVSFEYTDPDEIDNYSPFGSFAGMRTTENLSFSDVHRIKTTHSISWVRYLNKITIDNVEIAFTFTGKLYSEKAKDVNEELESARKLDRIQVRYLNEEKKRYTLSYYDQNTFGNPVLFLKQVTMPDGGMYKFDYYHRNGSFPLLGCYAIDHWGYYNNTTTENDFIPRVALTTSAPYLDAYSYDENALDSNYRLPDSTASRMGMLKEVIYPTGGTSSFTYEANTFSHQVERNLESFYLPKLVPANNYNRITGGVRIKTIMETDNNGKTSKREFIYSPRTEDGILQFPISSGNLLKVPRYNMSLDQTAKNNNNHDITTSLYRVTSSTPVTFTVDKTHIEYQNVLECRNDGSSIEYSFTDYNSTPDATLTVLFGSGLTNMVGTSHIVNPEYWEINNLFADPFSNHYNRGRLWLKTIRDSENQIVYKERYVFDTSSGSENVFKTWQMSIDMLYPMQVKLKQYRPTSVQKTEYRDGVPFVTTTEYEYNTNYQTTSEKITDSQGRTVRTRRQFPHDVTSSIPDFVTKMKNANVIRYPLKEISTLQSPNNSELLTGGSNYLFTKKTTQNSSFIVPQKVQSVSISSPRSLRSDRFNIESSLTDEITYTAYDNLGNLVHSTAKGNIPTTYIWGYGGQYLVAVIQNKAPTDITSIPGLNEIATTPLSGPLSTAQETALRNLSESLVTTYTYSPMVGVTSITDPSGRKTSYEYDSANRLQRVLDQDGKVLEQYDYHYANQ